MKRFLIGFLATIGALALLLVVVSAGAGFWLFRSFADAPLPERMVLTVDLSEPLEEAVDLEPFAALSLEQPLEVSELVLALERAALDPRVAGLVARLDATDHGFAVAEEVRAAIQAFAASGRPTVAWADSFGELGAGNEGYFIATAFDKISLQPGGQVGLTGLIAEVPFVKPLLDRLGIQAEVVRRSDFKTALDSVTETGLTEANATMLNQLLDGLYGTLVTAIAETRELAPSEVEQLIDDGPLEAEAALDAGLIDGLAYRDEVIDAALETAGEDAELMPLAAYARRADDELDGPDAVAALIVAQGMIQRGTARFERMIGADDLAESLAEAREDDAIDAVVLRLDTGGGSAVASETVGREVALLRDSGKPIIVSMGNAAASGGYWIAMGANHIVAQPATYTGSIGVIAGKPDLAGAWEQLGVNWASIQRGQNAGLLSVNRPLDPEGRLRLEESVEHLYERFKAGVAAGRGMQLDAVEAVAQGRVWLGAQALPLGLVDELGGLPTARAAAGRLLQLPEDARIELRHYPPRRSPFERLRGLADSPWLGMLADTMTWLRITTAPAPVEAQLPRIR